jgi:hypothetical protein
MLTLLALLSLVCAQTNTPKTWQVSRVFTGPTCDMSVGTAANVYALGECDPSKQPSCEWSFGSTWQSHSCETSPSMWGIFAIQIWQGSTISCNANIVTGSDLVMTAEFTYSALFNNCVNETEHGEPSSILYACDANRTNLIVSKFSTSDCSGAAVSHDAGAVGCNQQGPVNALLISPAFCDWFHHTEEIELQKPTKNEKQKFIMPFLPRK